MLFCEPKNRKSKADASWLSPLHRFQCSSASRKIGNSESPAWSQSRPGVSVLFCEPKNRKSDLPRLWRFSDEDCFSALLRAEKSEINLLRPDERHDRQVSVLFCEPKNRKLYALYAPTYVMLSFSALLRAEKSEIRGQPPPPSLLAEFQCSSASRKIGNRCQAVLLPSL